MSAKSKTIAKSNTAKTKAGEVGSRIKKSGQGKDRIQYLASLIKNISDALISTDMESNILEWNAAAESVYGWRAAEVAGRPMSMFIQSEYGSGSREETVKAVLEQGIWKGELTQNRKDGTRFPVTASVSLVKDKTDRPIGFVAINRDISERKQAEKILKESEEKYRALLETSTDIIIAHDITGHITYINPSGLKVTEYSQADLIGSNIAAILPPEELTEMKKRESARRRGEVGTYEYETKFISKSGKYVTVEVHSAPIIKEGQDPEFLINARDITERKRTDEIVTNIQKRFQVLIENAPDGIALLGLDGKLRQVTPSTQQILGYTLEEAQGQEPALLTHPDDLPALLGLLNDLIQNPGKVVRTEYRFRHKDSSWRWLESTISNMLAEPGLNAVVFNYRDITERKQAEEALRASEERFASAFLSSPNAIAISRTADGQFVDVNDAACRLFGYSREELVGHKSLELGLTDAETRQKIIGELKSRGTLRDFEITITARGGIQRNVLESIEAIRIGGEQCVLTNMIDISERKQAEKKLEQQNRRLKALREIDTAILASDSVESIVDAALSHIRELIGCHRAGTALIDWEANEAVIFNVRMAGETSVTKGSRVPLMLLQAMPQAMSKPLANNQPVLIHDLTELPDLPPLLQILSKEGLRSVCILPLFSQGSQMGTFNLLSEIPGFFDEEKISLGREVANQVAIALTQNHLVEALRKFNSELEERVIQRTAQLETANKELEAFAYSVSHDLRAPLRAITGYTNILVEDYGSSFDAEGQRVCGVISNEAQRMGQLIDDLLTFSRLSRAEIHFSIIDMQAMAQSVFNELTAAESRERIDLQIGNLPSVMGDPALIRQAWINLLANALKFTSRKERAVIKVGGTQNNEETVYFVQDNGAGFDMRYADKLFGVFQRLHSEREFEGTGVGLAIVQRVILRHGGRVWGEGQVDKGAAFYFALPGKEAPHE